MPTVARLPKLSPAQERVARRSRMAMLREEVALLAALAGAAARALDALLAQISLAAAPEAAKQLVLRATRTLATALRADVSQAVLQGRTASRRAALARLTEELRAASRALRLAEPLTVPGPSDGTEDGPLADAAADSYASAWRSAVVAAALRWADDPQGPLAARLQAAAAQQDHRLDRIAATEVSTAYNDEHEEACDAVAAEHSSSKAPWLLLLVRYWDATLDRKACPTCREMDGRYSLIGVDFAGGREPGAVHPRCRCVSTLLALTPPALLVEGFVAGLALAS